MSGEKVKKKKPGRSGRGNLQRLSKIQKDVAERSLMVTEADLQAYVPCHADNLIAESMLAGNCTREEIAEDTKLSAAIIKEALGNPAACAWISRIVHQNISHRLGLVDAAMMRRAVAGDVAAARLILDRYGQFTNRSVSLSLSASAEFSGMTTEDLEAIIKTTKHEVDKIIDVESVEVPSQEDSPADTPLQDL